MIKEESKELKKICLKIETPLYIGDRNLYLGPLDYLKIGKTLYLLSEKKFCKFLYKRNLIEKFSKWTLQESKLHISSFLEKERINISHKLAENLAYSSMEIKTNSFFKEIKPFTKDAFGVPYIPASTIKGVFRTALLYKILKYLKKQNYKIFEQKIINPIQQALKKDKISRREPFKKEINFWLQSFKLDGNTEGPLTDYLRILIIRDAKALFQKNTHLYEVELFSWNGKDFSPKDTRFFVEVLPYGYLYEVEIIFDKNLLSLFKKSCPKHIPLEIYPETINEFLNTVEEFFSDLWEYEKEVFKNGPTDYYKRPRQEKMFRLGWGGGLLSTTIFMLLPEEIRQEIRNRLRHPRGKTMAPKTRRLLRLSEKKKLPLGWVKYLEVGDTVVIKPPHRVVLALDSENLKLKVEKL